MVDDGAGAGLSCTETLQPARPKKAKGSSIRYRMEIVPFVVRAHLARPFPNATNIRSKTIDRLGATERRNENSNDSNRADMRAFLHIAVQS